MLRRKKELAEKQANGDDVSDLKRMIARLERSMQSHLTIIRRHDGV